MEQLNISGCMNPETECKSLVQCCAAMRFAKNIERCTLKDGGSGVCCSDFLGNKGCLVLLKIFSG